MFNLDYVQMVQNIATQSTMGGPIWTMVTAFCYIMAILMAFKSALMLRDISEQKSQAGYMAPTLTFLSATLLAGAPSAIAAMSATVFGSAESTSPLQYTAAQAGTSPIKAVLIVVQLIGYIFFVRGILELRRAGEPQRFQGASFGRSMTIMASGMAAIYIDKTLTVISTVTGWNVDAIIN